VRTPRLEQTILIISLVAWVTGLAGFLDLIPLAGGLTLGLYSYYSLAVALGWICGNVYIWRCRLQAGRQWRGRLLLIYLLGPPSMLFLLRSLAVKAVREAAPLAATWALGVYVILFFVPVTLKPRWRR